jgi:elongation factor G
LAATTFETEAIRNIVFLGHGSTGKTTLVDALCFSAGATVRKGSVKDGTAITDFTPEEKSHGISINTAVAHAVWSGTKLNLIDTPGYLDFAGEAKAGVRVADSAVILVDATSGVLVGTENVWEYCEERGIPRIFVVSMMDKENANFDAVLGEIRDQLSKDAMPIEIPMGSGENFQGAIDLLSGRARIFGPDRGKGEYREEELPEELQAAYERAYQELIEAIAVTDDSLLEEFLEAGSIEPAKALDAMKAAMKSGQLYPVVCSAPEHGHGVRSLLERLADLMPNPADAGPVVARSGDREVELEPRDGAPFTALIFKTTSEPHVGELSYFRVFSGSIAAGASAKNAVRGGVEKLGHLAIPQGKERLEVSELKAGDIGVVAKLRDTHTGDTLCAEGEALVLPGIEFPDADIAIAVKSVKRGDEDKVSTGLHKLHEEDPTFSADYDPELGQTIARGLGEMHLEVMIERLKRSYGVEVETEPPRIPYRETITKTAEGQGKYKKQTGGRGQYGDCWVRLSPLPRGSGYEFVDSIVGGVIPGKFVPSVDKGIQEAAAKGILAGYPVVDFRAEVYDGSHHSVDSSDIAFKVAGSLAFKNVAQSAGPILLEPVYEVEVTVPEEYMGDVIGDLNQRRGRILGMESRGKKQIVRAHVPLAELHKYSSTLRSITQGRGSYRMKFVAYEEVPPQIAEKIIEASREKEEVKK